MTITLKLQPDIERGLLARAQAKGISLADYVQEIVSREAQVQALSSDAQANPGEPDNLFELLAPVRGLLTNEEVDTLFSRNRRPGRPADLE